MGWGQPWMENLCPPCPLFSQCVRACPLDSGYFAHPVCTRGQSPLDICHVDVGGEVLRAASLGYGTHLSSCGQSLPGFEFILTRK